MLFLSEVTAAIEDGQGLPMNEIDSVQSGWLGDEDRWKPIWVKIFGEYSPTASRDLPVLTAICKAF